MRSEQIPGPEGDGVFRSGFVTLVGRPNAGKSTLLNAVVGTKVAITSKTPQTTRRRLRAVYNAPAMQMVLIDTPGLHKPRDPLGSELNRSALRALDDIDVVAMLVDATKPIGKGDAWVVSHIADSKVPRLLVVTKSDLADDRMVASQIRHARDLADFEDIIALSALEGTNVDGFIDAVARLLPEGPRWFPPDMDSDQSLEMIVAEFIREKVLRSTRDEVPYSVGVVVDEIEYDRKRNFNTVYATIYVERDSQKGIIIGSGGKMVKRIGTEARADLERLLGGGVHLDLMVKVRRNWRRDPSMFRRFGYGDDDD